VRGGGIPWAKEKAAVAAAAAAVPRDWRVTVAPHKRGSPALLRVAPAENNAL